jgi:hypothetical protein
MKLVSKKLKTNPETFAPEMEVTLLLPLEPVQDGKALNTNFYENLGKKFVSLLKSNKE